MILRFSPQSDSPYSQIFRKTGQKKAEPNSPMSMRRATKALVKLSADASATTLAMDGSLSIYYTTRLPAPASASRQPWTLELEGSIGDRWLGHEECMEWAVQQVRRWQMERDPLT
jgi:hypothetical protein